MRRFFGENVNGQIQITGEEFNHLKNVLRLGIGDQVMVYLGDEYEYACEIEQIIKKCAFCKIIGKTLCEGNPHKNIVLYQALPKRDKFEFIVQKATEIGISKVVPFISQYVVAKPTENKIERLKAIAKEACKQCERSVPPEICAALDVDKVIAEFGKYDIILFANERADKGTKIKGLEKMKNIAIIVGSEGGFSSKEKDKFVEAGATVISLGKRIYRTETASVAMMSLASILSEN